MTVIADPQGATFTASKFVPENQSAAGSRPRETRCGAPGGRRTPRGVRLLQAAGR